MTSGQGQLLNDDLHTELDDGKFSNYLCNYFITCTCFSMCCIISRRIIIELSLPTNNFWFGLVSIRPPWAIRTVAEPKEMGFSRETGEETPWLFESMAKIAALFIMDAAAVNLNNHAEAEKPVASSRGGGQAGQLVPPPQPPIGHPVRSMQIRGDYRVRKKNGGRITGFAQTFYMHRRYGRRSLVLRLRKKRELWKLLKELLW